jgi:hypothetical protein
MLLTRSLPPQFLLPAWSVRQIAQASQRAQKSTSTSNSLSPKYASRGLFAADKGAFRKIATLDDYPEQEQTEHKQQEAQTEEPLSLFDELFPEERKRSRQRERAAEKRLDKLPAFNWNSEINVKDRGDKERENKKKQYMSIPLRQDQVSEETTRLFKSIPLDNRYVVNRLRSDPDRIPRSRTSLSVLVLNACSKALEESDFFRLGPRGEHIEGWATGIIEGIISSGFIIQLRDLHLGVIPARDNNTLEKLGHYYILCSNDAAARAYLDNTRKLHNLAKSSMALEASGIPIPPGYLQDGEDPAKVLQGFSLVPAYGRLSLRMLNRPYRPPVFRMLKEGGPAARIIKESKAGEMVIFSVDVGHINQYDLLEALRDDGKRRNLHWKFGGDRANQIVRLDCDHQDDNLGEPDEGLEQSPDPDSESSRARKKNGSRRPPRYVISLKDCNEARRFVMEWHQRPFPVRQVHNPGDEPTPTVNTEILW